MFEAVIEAARRGGHVAEVPDGIAAEIGGRHMLRVRGELAGAPYRSNLAKMGGRLILGVHKATLSAAGRSTGDEVTVTIEADPEPR
jgi:hypothetical protein